MYYKYNKRTAMRFGDEMAYQQKFIQNAIILAAILFVHNNFDR